MAGWEHDAGGVNYDDDVVFDGGGVVVGAGGAAAAARRRMQPRRRLGPVQRSGSVRLGDRLVRINGVDVTRWTFREVMDALRGLRAYSGGGGGGGGRRAVAVAG